jgi:hypothetical protein
MSPFILRNILPRNAWGDRIFAFLRFLSRHNRFPSEKMLFNDVLYRLRASGQLGNPIRVFVSDKEYLKIYVKAIVGDEFNVPTLAVLHNDEEIDKFDFPDRCCIKATHSCSKTIIRRGGEKIDREKLKYWLTENYYNRSREINYKSLQPKIIIEPLIFGGDNLVDYKFFCYRGQCSMVQLVLDRDRNIARFLVSRDGQELPYNLLSPKLNRPYKLPENIEDMFRLAERLSVNFDFIRVDLYSNGREIYVGELTNCPGRGHYRFVPISAEVNASELIFNDGSKI